MKKKRIGNDLRFNWSISDGDGHPFSVEEKDLTLVLRGPAGRPVPVGDVSFEGKVVLFSFFGKDQKVCGKYTAILIENAGKEQMKTVDTIDIVELVPHTVQEAGEDSCSHLSIETIDLESSIIVGIPGPRGFSMYDYAVKYYGFTGTEREFWLWFLNAVQGAIDAAADAAAAQGSIEDSEADRARVFAELKADLEAAFANADSLVDDLRDFPVVFADELPEASAETMRRFYLIPSPSGGDLRDIYLSYKLEDEYRWRKVGGTNIVFYDYLRKDDVVLLTEDEYDALRNPDPNKYYLTYEDDGEEEL